MPRSASSFNRSIGAVCRVLALVVLLASVIVVPRVAAQSTPSPTTPHSSHAVQDHHAGHQGHHHHAVANPDQLGVQAKPAPNFSVLAVGTTNLSGGLEIPGPGDPNGTGSAQVQINLGSSQVCVDIAVQNIAPATAAHIHRGAVGVAGDIVVTLPTPNASGLANGCAPVNPPILAREILENPFAFYVNVHAGEFPLGAVRGQVRVDPPTRLQAPLSGAAEGGDGDPDGSGAASVYLDQNTSQVCVVISATNIVSDAGNLAHIHQAPAPNDGPIVVTLPTFPIGTTSVSGCVTGIDPTLLTTIANNPAGFYVNVHNTPFPGGAVRGQLENGAGPTHIATLSGASVVSGTGDANGNGISFLTAFASPQSLCVTTLVQDIVAPTAAHIHNAPVGMAGPDVFTLRTPENGAATECSLVPGVLASDINDDPSAYYIDVNTGTGAPNGDVRGQIASIAPFPAQADLQIVSKIDSPDPVATGQQITYTLTVRNNGPSTATGVTLTDVLPAGVTFVSATPNPGCVNASGTVTCALGNLVNGATSVVTIVVTAGSTGTVNNSASVTSGTADSTLGNNSAQASTTIQACTTSQRPRVLIQTAVVTVAGVPRLRATVTAQTSAQVPINGLTSIQFTQFDTARVNVLPSGPLNQTNPFTHLLPGSPIQAQFDVFRTATGVSATVRFIANDICGPWPSFVGAGPSVPI